MTGIAKQGATKGHIMAWEAAPAIPPRIYWGCHDSPFGPVLLGTHDAGLCKIALASGYGAAYDLSGWRDEWPDTEFIPDSSRTAPYACRISQMNANNFSAATLALYGASFQLKILKAMLQLPEGQSMSYAEVMQLVQKPKAA